MGGFENDADQFPEESLSQKDTTPSAPECVIWTDLRTGLGHPPLELFRSPPRRAPIGKGGNIFRINSDLFQITTTMTHNNNNDDDNNNNKVKILFNSKVSSNIRARMDNWVKFRTEQ